jgi:hypothetical protein
VTDAPFLDVVDAWTAYVRAIENSSSSSSSATALPLVWSAYVDRIRTAIEERYTKEIEAARDAERMELATQQLEWSDNTAISVPAIDTLTPDSWRGMTAPQTRAPWTWFYRCVMGTSCIQYKKEVPWTMLYRAKYYTVSVCPACWFQFAGSKSYTPTAASSWSPSLAAAIRAAASDA